MSGTSIILPVGVTKETVEGLLKSQVARDVSHIIAVLIRDSDELKSRKQEITSAIEVAARLLGAEYVEYWTSLGDEELAAKIYKILLRLNPSRVILSAITGSRYVLLPLIQALKWYSRRRRATVYVVHGVEGDGWILEPLAGYIVDKLTPAERRLFMLIYRHPGREIRTREDLIVKYGFNRSVYRVLGRLRDKGLIEWRRNRLRKTYPGLLLYNMLQVEED